MRLFVFSGESWDKTSQTYPPKPPDFLIRGSLFLLPYLVPMSLLKWSPNPTTERRQWALNLWNCLSETLEISIGSGCSVLTWRFVIHDEETRESDNVGVYSFQHDGTAR